MKCPKCQSVRSQVIDSRLTQGGQSKRRRRECECGHRFTTTEVYGIHASDMPLLALPVRKHGGLEEDFSEEKLRLSIERVYRRRNMPAQELEDAIEGILNQVRSHSGNSIELEELVKWTYEALLRVDRFVALRYAINHMEFDTPEQAFKFTK